MSTEDQQNSLPIVGWREWGRFPDLDIPAIKCKLDTGARTSALHTFHVEPFEEKGVRMVKFGVHPLRRRFDVERWCTAPVSDQRTVSDSGGHREPRWLIRTRVGLGPIEKEIEVSLTNRESMLFRVLLGRTAMQDLLLVDSGASYTLGRVSPRNIYGPRKLESIPERNT